LFFVSRLLAVAVVRLVVENQDVLHPHQLGHDPLQRLSFRFPSRQGLSAALE
jgi:hypothetical protein